MPIRTQDVAEPRSKQSTLFLSASAGGVWTELDDDDSQRFDDATSGAGIMTMTSPSSDRLNISHPRAITCRADVNSTDTGVFFTHGAGGNLLTFEINTAGTLRAVQNGGTVGSVAIPGLAGARTSYVLSWVSRANPLTTGASDAVQSWLLVLDDVGGEVARAEFFHAVKTGGRATATWGPFVGTVTGFSHESRAQSLTEIAIDWGVASPVAPTSDCEVVLPPMPVDVSSTLGDENELYGPAPAWAALHADHARRRTWSPLANVVYRTRPEIEENTAASNGWYRLAPGDDAYYMGLAWIAMAPVPPGCTHAYVRLHVQSWVTSGAAVPIGLRLYSLSQPPDQPAELAWSQIGEVVTRDDTASGDGQWDIEAVVRLSIGTDGWTYLCPAYAFDPLGASANDANAIITINALHVVPCYSETAGGA